MGNGVSKFLEQLGWVYQNHPQKRNAARGLVTALDQEGGGVTLRWGPSAPKCLVHRSKGGSSGVKMTINGKITILRKKHLKSLMNSISNVVYGLDGLRGNKSTIWGHR